MAESVEDIETEISQIQKRLFADKARLAELRLSLPKRPIADYELAGPGGSRVHLSEFFGGREDLLLIHNMGARCTYCTLWADGFNGVLDHLQNRAAVALISPDSPDSQAKFATSRGWRFRMVSAEGSTINADLAMVGEDGVSAYPGVSALSRTSDGEISLVAQSYFGPGDDFCSVWPLLDLLDGGAKGWEPQYKYTD